MARTPHAARCSLVVPDEPSIAESGENGPGEQTASVSARGRKGRGRRRGWGWRHGCRLCGEEVGTGAEASGRAGARIPGQTEKRPAVGLRWNGQTANHLGPHAKDENKKDGHGREIHRVGCSGARRTDGGGGNWRSRDDSDASPSAWYHCGRGGCCERRRPGNCWRSSGTDTAKEKASASQEERKRTGEGEEKESGVCVHYQWSYCRPKGEHGRQRRSGQKWGPEVGCGTRAESRPGGYGNGRGLDPTGWRGWRRRRQRG